LEKNCDEQTKLFDNQLEKPFDITIYKIYEKIVQDLRNIAIQAINTENEICSYANESYECVINIIDYTVKGAKYINNVLNADIYSNARLMLLKKEPRDKDNSYHISQSEQIIKECSDIIRDNYDNVIRTIEQLQTLKSDMNIIHSRTNRCIMHIKSIVDFVKKYEIKFEEKKKEIFHVVLFKKQVGVVEQLTDLEKSIQLSNVKNDKIFVENLAAAKTIDSKIVADNTSGNLEKKIRFALAENTAHQIKTDRTLISESTDVRTDTKAEVFETDVKISNNIRRGPIKIDNISERGPGRNDDKGKTSEPSTIINSGTKHQEKNLTPIINNSSKKDCGQIIYEKIDNENDFEYKAVEIDEVNVPSQNVPFQNDPPKNVPFQNVPFQNVPFQNVPFQNVPFQNVPFQNVPFQNVQLTPWIKMMFMKILEYIMFIIEIMFMVIFKSLLFIIDLIFTVILTVIFKSIISMVNMVYTEISPYIITLLKTIFIKVSLYTISTSETPISEIGGNEIGGNEIGGNEIGGNEIGGNEIGGNEIGGNEIGGNEIDGNEIGGNEIGGNEIGASKNDIISDISNNANKKNANKKNKKKAGKRRK
jgi:hypothetical protein